MKRLVLTSVVLLGWFAPGPVWAQGYFGRGGYGGYQNGGVSPYLQLNRLGAPPALNYYNLVRPQFQFGNAIQQLGQQVITGQQDIANLETPTPLPPTGHAVGFQTHLRYFGTFTRPGGAFGRAGTALTQYGPQPGQQLPARRR